MALNYTPKGAPSGVTPSQTPQTRTQIKYGTPQASTARVDALKARLSKAPPQQPVAPRPAGSTARAEGLASQKKYPPQPSGQVPTLSQPLQDVEPPPSSLSQPDTSVETGAPQAEANAMPPSSEFVALSKQSKMIRKAQLELKAAQEAFKREKEGLISKSDLASDTLRVLAEAGITNDKLVELQINQVAPDPNQALLQKIEALEAKLAAVDSEFTKRDTRAYDAAVNQIRNDAKLLVDSDPAFETIKSEKAEEDVVELIKRVFDSEGTVLNVDEAAKMVEEKLVDRKWQDYERISKLSKIKSRMAPPAEIPAEANQLKQQPMTLTNSGAAHRPLTPRERAIAAIERAKRGE